MTGDGSIPQRVRADAAKVMQRAQYIEIHPEKIPDYACHLVSVCPLVTTLDRDNHFVSDTDREKTAAFVFALDSTNFGSGVFADAQKAGIDLEYSPFARRLKNAFEADHMCRAEEWLSITAAQCHDIFQMPVGKVAAIDQLMADFARHLSLTGRAIVDGHGGIGALLDTFNGRGADLLEEVAQWHSFQDLALHQGEKIAIFKRAQILLADLELALASPEQPYFGGLTDLTCFADNMVPHVLRTDSIISYHPVLADLVDRGQLIDAGSDMEAELRCAAIHVVELMRAALQDAYTSVNLDHMLWHRGYGAGFSPYQPHRTITTLY